MSNNTTIPPILINNTNTTLQPTPTPTNETISINNTTKTNPNNTVETYTNVIKETGVGNNIIENNNSKNIIETRSIIWISIGIVCFLILVGIIFVGLISKRNKMKRKAQQIELDNILSKRNEIQSQQLTDTSFQTGDNENEMQIGLSYSYPVIQEYMVPNQDGSGYVIEYYDQYGQRYDR